MIHAELRAFLIKIWRFARYWGAWVLLIWAVVLALLPAMMFWLGEDAEAMPAPGNLEGPTVIFVDKATSKLKLLEYHPSGLKLLKDYQTTVGRVQGDKLDEGDLKTPEGIYSFTSLLRPPSIKPKFGVMAFYMNFPNPFDRMAGLTGFDIMLHATDEPQRLQKEFDSEGCVVVENSQLKELESYIQIGLTPILVFSKLDPSYLKPEGDEELLAFFNGWIEAWESRDVDRYIGNYHSAFRSGGRSREEYRDYKSNLNKVYSKITVEPTNVQYFRHPKYNMIMFTQNYRSYTGGGRVAHLSRGTKTIYVAQEQGKFRIIDEDFTPRIWNYPWAKTK